MEKIYKFMGYKVDTFIGYHGLAAPKEQRSSGSYLPLLLQGTGELGTGIYTSDSLECARHYSRGGGVILEIYSTSPLDIVDVDKKDYPWTHQGNGNNNEAIDTSPLRLKNGLRNKFEIFNTSLEKIKATQVKINQNSYSLLRIQRR